MISVLSSSTDATTTSREGTTTMQLPSSSSSSSSRRSSTTPVQVLRVVDDEEEETKTTTSLKRRNSSRSSRSTSRVRVTFNPNVLVLTVRPLNHFKGYKQSNFFYTSIDYERIKYDIKRAIELIQDGKQLSSQEDEDTMMQEHHFTSRGIEYHLLEGRSKRNLNKSFGKHALFQQQNIQRRQGTNDPYKIAKVYENATKHCSFDAYQIGIYDQIEARRIYTTTTSMMSSLSKTKQHNPASQEEYNTRRRRRRRRRSNNVDVQAFHANTMLDKERSTSVRLGSSPPPAA